MSSLHLDFWPHKGTTEWVQFEWDDARDISRVKVYWFDDTGRGECRLPASWRILYRDNEGSWQPAKNKTPYITEKDALNQVDIEPVHTKALRIEAKLQNNWSAGIQEVIIE
jgi:hypothetical protein